MAVLQEYLCCTKNTKPISTLSKTRKTSYLNYQKNVGMFYLFFPHPHCSKFRIKQLAATVIPTSANPRDGLIIN